MNEAERTLLTQQIDNLASHQAKAGLVTSLYIPSDRLDTAAAFLRSEMVNAAKIRNRVTREGVLNALRCMKTAVETSETQERQNGIAVFSDGISTVVIRPPEPILGFDYRCARAYYTDPLRDILLATSVSGLLVIDRGEATVGWTDGRCIVGLLNIESFVQGKHHMGGASQARYARIIEHQVTAFFRKVAEQASAVLLRLGPRLTAIYVGGPGFTKDEFLSEARLDYRLLPLIRRPTYHTGYTDIQGLRELSIQIGWRTAENLASVLTKEGVP